MVITDKQRGTIHVPVAPAGRGTFESKRQNPALTVNQLLNMKLFVNVKIVFQNLTKQCCKSYFHISESFAPMGKTSGPGPGSGKMAQSWEKKKKVSKSKVRQAVCRYCRLSMAAQNYLRHLKISHKDEWESNPGDLKEAGDRAISFFNPVSSSGGAVLLQALVEEFLLIQALVEGHLLLQSLVEELVKL